QRTMEDAARDADLGDVADVVKNKGKLNKLPFDNQVVNSLKEFERTVKAETTDAMRAAEGSTSSTASSAEAAGAPASTPTPKPVPAKPVAAPTPAPAPAAAPQAAEAAPAAEAPATTAKSA
ncbi:MAG: hypothetical protein AAGF90_23715, partial [Pseudomonadota bacterium]